ncbi:MAG: hypothetical protein JWM95_726 [Gemmatimonadetes bacterium]|nr:hypothetical protein [Gemmatimonadota bacterium]
MRSSLDQFESVYDLYFATVYGHYRYLQNRFLNIAQAIQSFHRRKDQGTLLSKAEFRALKAEMKGCMQAFGDRIHPDIFETLESRLQFFNEYTLRERLVALFPDDDQVLEGLTGGIPAFRDDIRHTRNYLTHYSVGEERKATEGTALLRLTMRMQPALCRLLLQELGIPDELTDAWIKRQARRIDPIGSVWETGE